MANDAVGSFFDLLDVFEQIGEHGYRIGRVSSGEDSDWEDYGENEAEVDRHFRRRVRLERSTSQGTGDIDDDDEPVDDEAYDRFRASVERASNILEEVAHEAGSCFGDRTLVSAHKAKRVELRARRSAEDPWISIGFLDQPLDAERLLACCDPAPFGDLAKMTTVYDESVRKAFECPVTPDRVQFRVWPQMQTVRSDRFGNKNGSFHNQPFLVDPEDAPDRENSSFGETSQECTKQAFFHGWDALLPQMEEFLGRAFDRRRLELRPYKLNLYAEGGFFKPHVDTPTDGTRMFASLVVGLPVYHESGGELLVHHSDGTSEFSFQTPSLQGKPTSDPDALVQPRIFEVEDETDRKQPETDWYQIAKFRNERSQWDSTKVVYRLPRLLQESKRVRRIEPQGEPIVTFPWAAFYSDCVHEVLPVGKGFRATITFSVLDPAEKGSENAWPFRNSRFDHPWFKRETISRAPLSPERALEKGRDFWKAIEAVFERDCFCDGLGIVLKHCYTGSACDSTSDPSAWDRLKGEDSSIGNLVRRPPAGWKSAVLPIVRQNRQERDLTESDLHSYEDIVCAARLSDLRNVLARKRATDLPSAVHFFRFGNSWGRLLRRNVDRGAEYTGNESRASSVDKVYYTTAVLLWKESLLAETKTTTL